MAVTVRGLTVVYGGQVRALNKVSLGVPKHQITGLIGPSGSGKTTLIEAIIGYLKVAPHTISVFDETVGSAGLRETVAYMPQDSAIYTDLTVRQNLIYFARILGLRRAEAKSQTNEILRAVGLTGKANSLVHNLSGGQKQRVSLAVALLGRPKLLVLDEPTSGLDPVLIENLWKLFNKLVKDGATLIISSHSMTEAARCDNLVLLRDGRIIASETPKALLRKTGARDIEQAFLKLVGGDK